MNWRVHFTYCSVIYMARPSLRPLAITIALKCTMHQRNSGRSKLWQYSITYVATKFANLNRFRYFLNKINQNRAICVRLCCVFFSCTIINRPPRGMEYHANVVEWETAKYKIWFVKPFARWHNNQPNCRIGTTDGIPILPIIFMRKIQQHIMYYSVTYYIPWSYIFNNYQSGANLIPLISFQEENMTAIVSSSLIT